MGNLHLALQLELLQGHRLVRQKALPPSSISTSWKQIHQCVLSPSSNSPSSTLQPDLKSCPNNHKPIRNWRFSIIHNAIVASTKDAFKPNRLSQVELQKTNKKTQTQKSRDHIRWNPKKQFRQRRICHRRITQSNNHLKKFPLSMESRLKAWM